MLGSRVVQVGGRFLGREAVVVFPYGSPEDKDLDPGIRRLLKKLTDFGGPPKTMSSGRRKDKYQPSLVTSRVERAEKLLTIVGDRAH